LNNYLRNIDEDAVDDMKARFASTAEEYTKILRSLDCVDREIRKDVPRADNYIADIYKNLAKLKQLNGKQSHTICILGLEKAGKSTFINALLGYELLPAASERCTQVRTVLKPPIEDGEQQLYATVKFYNDTDFRVFHEKMPKKTDESEQQLANRKIQVMEARENLRHKFPEEQFRISTSTNVSAERENIHQKLHEYITGELYVNIIQEIAIYTDKLPGMS
jgi:thymidylate kinase